MRVQVRWMIRRDMSEVLAIESACFQLPWTDREFTNALRGQGGFALVAEREDAVVGYLVARLGEPTEIVNMGVRADCQRQGVGRALIDRITGRRSSKGVVGYVSEGNLTAQLFLRATGFRATGIERRFYVIDDSDAIRFECPPVAGATEGPRIAGLQARQSK